MERVTVDVAGRPLILETGRLAKQADAAVLVTYGGTVILVTCAVTAEPATHLDMVPLRVDFEEKMYAVGRIPGGFFKREGRPSEDAILTCRKIDRPIRPLLPPGLRNEVQVIATALSAENQSSVDVVSMIGGSAAVALSSVPFNGPFAAAQVGRIEGQYVLNPSFEDLQERSDVDVLVAATREGVVQLEMDGLSVPESVVIGAVEVAVEACRPIVAAIEELVAKAGKPKGDYPLWEPDAEVAQYVNEQAKQRVEQAILIVGKAERDAALNAIAGELVAALAEAHPNCEFDVRATMNKIAKAATRRSIVDGRVRVDGRQMDEIRPIEIEVGLLPRTHGSALFTRGETQALTVTTLGPTRDQKMVRTLQEEDYQRFMHQYNFPPFCVGEVRGLRAPGRREIGHGALAEKALERVLPPEEEFPYTIRLVSEILESNGSSSMAAVCGSTLALMDGGVPISAPVAGISVGVVYEDPSKFALLVDLQGNEDQLGSDMDFKVAGTRDGINAIHLDMKVQGLPSELLREALELARRGRLRILDQMAEVIPYPRSELSPYAPRIYSMTIDKEKIGLVIGPGGKMIRKIEADHSVEIDIQDDGTIYIAATNEEGATGARQFIESMTREIEVGEVINARVTKTTPFGAFAEVAPGKEGLIHISELAWEHVRDTEDVVNVGDMVEVKVLEPTEDGKLRLSRKALLPRPPRPTGGEGGGRPERPERVGGRPSGPRPPRRSGGPPRSQEERLPGNAHFREPRHRDGDEK
jgi:polyribonucleotide nucleotidyltransferase